MTLSSPRVAVKDVAFALPQQGTAISLHRSSLFNKACSARPATCRRYCCRAPTAKATPPGPDDPSEEQSKVQRMRSRLEGLFGSAREDIKVNTEIFDGVALRDAIRERWGVEYDVQPQRRHGRVYVQVRLVDKKASCKRILTRNQRLFSPRCRLCGGILSNRAFTWKRVNLPVTARLSPNC